MDKISTFNHPDEIEKQAADWLIKMDGDESLSPEELSELKHWIATSPQHKKTILALNQFWQNTTLTQLNVPLGRPENQQDNPAPNSGWSTFYQGLSRLFSWPVLTLFCATLCISLVWWKYQDPIRESNGLYATAVGQQKSVSLADGSVIQLNTNSQVEVSFDSEFRNIRLLQGEAHFDVAKNPSFPFRVYAGEGRVQAVGTAFSVYLQDSHLNVLVTEGIVALASLTNLARTNDNAPAPVTTPVDKFALSNETQLGQLVSGQEVTLSMNEDVKQLKKQFRDATQETTSEDPTNRQSWREGWLVFNGEPLEKAVEEISRYTTMTIEIADESVKKIPIGGRFKIGNVEDMFAALEVNFGLSVNKISYNRVRLTLSEADPK